MEQKFVSLQRGDGAALTLKAMLTSRVYVIEVDHYDETKKPTDSRRRVIAHDLEQLLYQVKEHAYVEMASDIVISTVKMVEAK